jgi:GH18 family chitinase
MIQDMKELKPEMKVLGAFGGWKMDVGFSEAAATGDMKPLAEKIVAFKTEQGL